MAAKTLEEVKNAYIAGQPIEQFLPLKAKGFDFTLGEVLGHCPDCGERLVNLRGTVVDHGICIEVRSTGICQRHQCFVLMCPFRYYEDGHILYHDTQFGWVGGQISVKRWYTTLLEWLGGLLGRK